MPTGLRPNPSGSAETAARERICVPVRTLDRKVSSGAKGWSVRSRTVSGSGTSMALTADTLLRLGDCVFSSSKRSSVNFTSSEVSVLPSWNLTPWRRRNSSAPSSVVRKLSARSGTGRICASSFSNPLYRAQIT